MLADELLPILWAYTQKAAMKVKADSSLQRNKCSYAIDLT
jgi:hypothetical protein